MNYLFYASLQASLLALVTIVIQHLVRRRLSARLRHALWLPVVLRLAIPIPLHMPALLPAHHMASHPLPVWSAPLATFSAISIPTTTHLAPVSAPWPVLASLYFLGLFLFVLVLIVSSVRLWFSLRKLQPITDPAILALYTQCTADLHLRNAPTLFLAPDTAPALVGFIRPRILLPLAVLSYSPDEIRLILAHELTHHRRLDVPANYALSLIQAVHFFNPFVYYIAARIRADRELACDEQVLSAADPQTYGRTLLKLVESLSSISHTFPPAGAVGILERSNHLHRRITMIASASAITSGRRFWSLTAVAALLLTGALLCTDAVRAADAKPSVSQPASIGSLTITGGTISSVDARLTARLPQLKFDSIPLTEALAYVRDAAKLNLFIDRKALEGSGIDLTEPVTLDLKDISVAQAFRMIGKAVSNPSTELGAQAEDDVIIFTVLSSSPPQPSAIISSETPGFAPSSGQGDDTEIVTRVYDVSKIVSVTASEADISHFISILDASLSRIGNHTNTHSIQMLNGRLVIIATADIQSHIADTLTILEKQAPTAVIFSPAENKTQVQIKVPQQ